jgi:hypothetical protein
LGTVNLKSSITSILNKPEPKPSLTLVPGIVLDAGREEWVEFAVNY